MNRGILIAVEGIDGAGKTTQIELLASFLREFGDPVVTSKEPTGGNWGQIIRESALKGRMSLEEELRAFVEDRKEHVRDTIGPALAAGKIVILDRYFYSTIAYQGSRGGNVDAITKMVRATAPEPDAAILLDVPAELGMVRVRKRDEEENHFEEIGNLRAVREAFREIAQTNKLTVIDGTPSIPVVRRSIAKSLLEGVLHIRYCAKPWGCDDPANCEYRMTDSCRLALMLNRLSQFS